MRDAEALGLDTLVEAHDAAELERATSLGAPVIGVNARDLSTFAIDRHAQLRLLAQAPRDRIVIAESAIATRAQGAAAELTGARAMLVGSTLMRAPDPGAKLAELISRPQNAGTGRRRLFSLTRAFRMKRVLKRMLDEKEFLSPHGVRSISRVYLDNPYVFESEGYRAEVKYTAAESGSDLFGGNSNWRGPIWMPVNYLMVESLCKFGSYYGDGFRVECPTGSGRMLTLNSPLTKLPLADSLLEQ